MAKPGRFPMTDSSGAPLHSSDTVKDSSLIIACNAAPARCSVAAMMASRSPGSGQQLDGQLLQPCTAGQQARGLVRRQVNS
jgi:hypothetical protein